MCNLGDALILIVIIVQGSLTLDSLLCTGTHGLDQVVWDSDN